MAKYASFGYGLRGCYSDGEFSIIKFNSRKELKRFIVNECMTMLSDGDKGASKKAIATYVADYWTRCNSKNPGYLSSVLPIKPQGASSYSWGFMLSPATRQEYKDQSED